MTIEELELIVHARDAELILLKKRVDELNRSLDKGTASASASSNRNLQKVGRVAGRTGLAITAGIGIAGVAALKLSGDFEQSLNIFQAVSHSTRSEMAATRKEAIKLGADTKLPATSAKDAALAMTELAKGGLTARQAMGAARGTLQLSAAAGIANAEAATIQVRALNAFNLKGKEAARVADILAAAANASTGEITDFADGFRNASAQAARLKVPIEDMTTALALMADKGIEGATAGVSLKVMMTRFVPTTKKAIGMMSELGIITEQGKNRLFDAKGEFIGIAKASDIFRNATKKLTTEQKVEALQLIFGMDAQRAANVVLLGGQKAWDKKKAAVTRAGEAERIAAARNKGLKGAMDALKSTLETVAIIFGTILSPAVEVFLRSAVIPMVGWLGKHKTVALVLSGALLILGVGLLALSLAVKTYTFVTADATKATLAWTASLLTNPVFLIIAAIVLLGIALVVAYKKSETFRNVVDKALRVVAAAGAVLMDVFRWFHRNSGTIWSVVKVAFWPTIQAIKLGFELAKLYGGFLVDVFQWFHRNSGPIWNTVKAVVGPVLGFVKDRIDDAVTVAGKLRDAFVWARDHAGPIWSKVWSTLKKPLELIVDTFERFAGYLGKIKDGFGWIVDNAKKLGGAFSFVSGAVGSEMKKVTPPGGATFPGGSAGTGGVLPGLWDEIALGRSHGLTLTDGYSPRPGDHGIRKAIDMSNAGFPTPQMAAFAMAVMGRPGVKDVIYGGLPFWQDNGRIVTGWGGNEGLRLDHLNHVHASIFDKGGVLLPGWTLAFNGTGRAERVLGPNDGAGLIVQVHVAGSVASERDLVEAVHEGLKAIDRRNFGTGLRT